MAVLGDRRPQAPRARHRPHAAPGRDDVPVPVADQRPPTIRSGTARPTGSRLASTTPMRRSTAAGVTIRRPTTAPRSSSPTPTTTHRWTPTPCGPGRRSCAATTRSSTTSVCSAASIPSTRRSKRQDWRSVTPPGSPSSSTSLRPRRTGSSRPAGSPCADRITNTWRCDRPTTRTFRVQLPPGTYDVRWFDIDDRKEPVDELVVERAPPRRCWRARSPTTTSSVVHLDPATVINGRLAGRSLIATADHPRAFRDPHEPHGSVHARDA